MKQARAVLMNSLGVGCALVAAYVGAQPPSGGLSVEIVREQYQQQEELVTNALNDALKTGRGAGPEERQALRDKLRLAVEGSFSVRQVLQQAELENLRRRLDELEQARQDREKHKAAIIDARVDELLSGQPAEGTVRIRSRVTGEVTRIGQTEELKGQGERSLRPLTVGDNVKEGDLLAVVRKTSTTAWSDWQIRAPRNGVIVEKDVNVGEIVDST